MAPLGIAAEEKVDRHRVFFSDGQAMANVDKLPISLRVADLVTSVPPVPGVPPFFCAGLLTGPLQALSTARASAPAPAPRRLPWIPNSSLF